ncbi:MAG TPA: hypothetical protein VFN78_14575 [Ktedonobacterales bacterium]|nr:hypothetical protein [Ktedonobacterales bacterium]
MRLAMRVLGMIVGFVAAIVMLVIDILYSLAHVLGRAAGITADSSHFFIGLLFVIVGFVGALMAPFSWGASIVLMLIATVAFFFVTGWWAIIPAVFFIVAMWLVYRDRGQAVQAEHRVPSGV